MSEYREVDDRKLGQYALDCMDADELANACRRLGITGPLEPLLRDLKAKNEKYVSPASPASARDSPRKISQRRDNKRSTSQNKQRQSPDHHQPYDTFGTKDNCGGGGNAGYGQNSYGKESKDSGIRDLSPEPNPSSHRRPNELTESQIMDSEAGGTSAMLHLASKLQVAALSALQTEVIELSERLKKSELERDSIQKQLHDTVDEKERTQRRLESIGSAHESRITEMHCVIVELSKKLKYQQENAILEDQEPDGSHSVSELSFQEGSVYNSEMECANSDQQSHTEPLDVKLEQPDVKSESHYSLPPMTANAGNQMQMQAMEEEILHLRSQMALLQSKLASVQDTIDTDAQSKKLDDLENVRISPNAKSTHTNDDACNLDETTALHIDELITKAQMAGKKSQKMKSMTVQPVCDSLSALSGSLPSQHIVGHREADLAIEQYIECNRRGKTLATDDNAKDLESTMNIVQEMQRLQRALDYLRVQTSVLSLNFGDCKANCEHLYLLCGKYESNAIALNQALNLSDRTVEAYDVMLALLESKLAMLENSESAFENRKTAERVAKHLMQRLESERSIDGNSLGPWQDVASVMCTSSTSHQVWTDNDDVKLREQMSKLKGQRANIQNTVVIFESPHKEYESVIDKLPSEQAMNDSRKAELEAAILHEELLSVKENFSEMKGRAEQLEREKNLALEGLINVQEQLAESESLLSVFNKKNRSTSYSDNQQTADIELELVEALARESRLKARLHALTSSLESATRASEEKYCRVQSTLAELKQANLSLTQSLDRCKRKYQARLKRMEQQLREMTLKRESVNGDHSPVPETTV